MNISFETVHVAIGYLHGNGILEKDIARNSIPFLLAAKAFGIFGLEERVKKHLTQKLNHQVGLIVTEIQIIELVLALRELYGQLSGEVEIGKEVVGVVAACAAHACCRKLDVFKKSPEFMGLMKEFSVLAYNMLASDVEVVPVVRNGDSLVEGEESVNSGEGLVQETREVVTEVVGEVTTDVVEEVTTEIVKEVVEEVATEIVKEVVEEIIEEVVEEAVEPMEE